MNVYTFISLGYSLLDKLWLGVKGVNPRKIIEERYTQYLEEVAI